MTTVPATQHGSLAPGQTTEMTPGGNSLTSVGETNQAALAAQAEAEVRACYIMADRRPRSWATVRIKLLDECRRPTFARSARYRKPVGGTSIEGPSIRFAEACLRLAGNAACVANPVFEDRTKRVLAVSVIDYETNARWGTTVTINKVVERKNPSGRVIVTQRTNTSGGTVFVVEATDDELLNLQNALISKAARNHILRLVPGDIIEEAQAVCVEVMQSDDQKDPKAARKRAFDGWAGLGVMPNDLERYYGVGPDGLTNQMLVDSLPLYNAIKDGETTWIAAMEAKHGEKAAPDATRTGHAQAKSVTEKVKARTGAKKPDHDPTTGEVKDLEVAASDNPDEGA